MKPTVTYDEQFRLVTIDSVHGNLLTPNEAFQLYMALGEILSELPQPLSLDNP